jgi:DNA-binding response OmpR family regulator
MDLPSTAGQLMTPAPGPIRIMLAEDEALLALDVQDALEAAGFVVVAIANRVADAVALVAAESFDVAILDVNLDGVQIWPAADMLRQRRIPFILLTGLLSSAEVPASCAGVPRLSKPVHYPTLIETIAGLLKKARATSDAR